MKKLWLYFLLSVLLLGTASNHPSQPESQSINLKRDSVYVKTSIFELVYSEALEQPKWVKYTVQCPNGKASRKGMEFFTNDSIHTSDNFDYLNNVWDRGHMAPAADFNCDSVMLRKTFTYMNCALQHEQLNRGVWKELEAYERVLALKNTVSIIIKVKFSTTKLSTGATLPAGFYKFVAYGKITEKYYFPNIAPKYTDYKKYKIK